MSTTPASPSSSSSPAASSASASGPFTLSPWYAAPAQINAAPLLHLLAATKPDTVSDVLTAVFRGRHEGVSREKRARIAESLGGLADKDTQELLTSIAHLEHAFLFRNIDTKEACFALFPSDFHTSLRALLSKLLVQHSAEWKEVLLNDSVGPAKLVEFDWRVDVKTASNYLSHMAVPTLLVDMKLQPPPTQTHVITPLESVNFELTPQALNTLLNGLEKIQSQLSAMK